MNAVEQIQGLLAGTCDGRNWYGPPLMKILDGLEAEEAAGRPIPNAHSIREIVVHITGWMRDVERCLKGESPTDSRKWDWKEVQRTTRDAWREALEELVSAHRALLTALDSFPEEKLDDSAIGAQEEGAELTFRFVLNGLGHHNAYHSAQIVLLRRLMGDSKHV